MVLKDNSKEKWVLKEHTRVKHEILKQYLKAWIPILGSWNKRICYFDCFAGRGEYEDGTIGSPLIAMEIAGEMSDYIDQLTCVFIEKDSDNFDNLKKVVEQNISKYPNVKPIYVNDEFANAANKLLNFAERTGKNLIPSFFFIDPFGFKGVPFDIIKRIMSFQTVEVFINFMTRDLARFLNLQNLENNIDDLFGSVQWRSIIYNKLFGYNKEVALRDLYINQLREEANVKYVWPFRVCLPEKRQTLYYLIHATNHIKGIKKMKEVMYNQGTEGMFAYLGPDDCSNLKHMQLFDPDYLELKNHLVSKYANKIITFDQLIEQTIMDSPCLEKHHRQAIKELSIEGKVVVEPVSSKTKRGLKGNDIIKFLN